MTITKVHAKAAAELNHEEGYVLIRQFIDSNALITLGQTADNELHDRPEPHYIDDRWYA